MGFPDLAEIHFQLHPAAWPGVRVFGRGGQLHPNIPASIPAVFVARADQGGEATRTSQRTLTPAPSTAVAFID